MFEWHTFCLECISPSLHFGIKIYCVEWGALETAPRDEGMAPDNLQHLWIIKGAATILLTILPFCCIRKFDVTEIFKVTAQ